MAEPAAGDKPSLTIPAYPGAVPTLPAPELAILMPTHRGEAWLGTALGSLVGEIDDRVEVILVDSSPDEATLAVARGYRDRLRLTIVSRPSLRSWTAQTNLAAGFASAPHLAMLHQDDLWLPGRMAAIRRWIAADPQAVLHVAPTRVIDAHDRTLGTLSCPVTDGAALAPALLVQNFVSVPAPVFRADAFAAAGGLDEALWYTADWNLWLTLARAGRVAVHPETLTGFRIHSGSQTVTGSRDLPDFRAQMQIVLDRHGAGAPRPIARAARVSIAVNTALAGGLARGGAGRLARAAGSLAALGPAGLAAFWHNSRIAERLLPRLRARMAGNF